VSPEIVASVRRRNHALAARFYAFCSSAGLLKAETGVAVLEFAAEMIDRFLALAYEVDLAGDDSVVAQGVEMIARYLESYATPAGITGVPAAELTASLAEA